ncbi:hypothetical protein KM043_017667 [Ampulex compressa]|nr:hypothetical protein KM043_017667 [Ampulex compressa]
MYFSGFLRELELGSLVDITNYTDNQDDRQLTENSMFHARSKHIDIRHLFVLQVVRNRLLKLIYLLIEEMIADVLIKALPGKRDARCTASLGLETGKQS